jgi:hypothetical protein
MAHSGGELNVADAPQPKSLDRRPYAPLALNAGIAVFLLDGLWQLGHGPFETLFAHRFHTLLLYAGLALAGVIWITTLRGAFWFKVALSATVLAGTSAAALHAIHQFDADERLLSPGTFADGRVVYPELGLSFTVPSGWRMNLQPFVRQRTAKARATTKHTRIRYGETAVFFQAAPASAASSSAPIADSVQIEGGPFIFRSLGRTLTSVRGLETSYQSMANVRIIQSTRYSQIGELDVAEFQLIDSVQQILYRHVFVRSGDIRLDFVLTSPARESPTRFDDLIRSIRVTRRPTQFDL